MQGKCVCFAGQSAVGKSSILNMLDQSLDLETGGLSRKTDRGKHTTRRAELMYLSDCDAYAADTPGFSMYDTELKKDELRQWYPEIKKYGDQCRFVSCLHDKEPDCMVKTMVDKGIIHRERYERYLQILHSMEE